MATEIAEARVHLRRATLLQYIQRLAVPFLLIMFIVYLGFSNATFITPANLVSIASSIAPIAIVAMGMALLLISGNFDLSVGGVGALGVVAGSLVINHTNTLVGVLMLIVMGLVCGAINGFLVTVVGINSLVATLGTGYIWSGVAYVLAGSSPIILKSNALPNFITFAPAGVQVSVLIAVAVIVAAYFYSRTVMGYSLYAIGSNKEAAKLAGIPVRTATFLAFVLTGLFAGVASIITVAYIGGGVPETGTEWPLEAIAAAVVGGVSITGGEGSIWAAVVGMALIGVVQNGLVLLNINSNLQTVVLGIIIIVAVATDVRFRQRFGEMVTSVGQKSLKE
jgi:ribose/xylose/arabinose/galactoside ABC-type transport system permease subunit